MTSIGDLERMRGLLELKLESCRKLMDVSAIRYCKDLKYLMLNRLGPIPDISFVDELDEIEFISFMDVNVLNGKIECLRRLRNLKYAAFDNKRHYDARMEEIAPGPFKWGA